MYICVLRGRVRIWLWVGVGRPCPTPVRNDIVTSLHLLLLAMEFDFLKRRVKLNFPILLWGNLGKLSYFLGGSIHFLIFILIAKKELIFLVPCTRLCNPLCLPVGWLVGWLVTFYFFFNDFIFLTPLLLLKWSCDLKYGPCPPARNFGSQISGLVFGTMH